MRLTRGEGWDGDPSEPGGPRGWAPLLYVCHSVFASAALARELLARGADPNVTFTNEYGEMSALYGAAGVVHDVELTRVLLEAGANPDDGESVYHSTEAESPECLRALLEHGATVEPIMVAHALDDERMEHVRLLLDAGVDARGLLVHAVRRGRGPEYLRLLVERGAEPRVRGRRGVARRRSGGAPPTSTRCCATASDSARTLAELGADTTVAPDDLAVAAIARGERPDGVPDAFDHDQQEVLILAALRGRMADVVSVLGPNFRGVVGGSPEGSLLQHASWVGGADLVAFLLAAGAEVVPLEWAVHGSSNHGHGDYVGVAERLVAAGAVIEPRLSPGGRRPARRVACSTSPDAEPEGRVVGPLAALRQRADRWEQAAEDREVERGDREPAGGGGQRLGTRREDRGEHGRPAEREREVHGRAGREQDERALLARQQHAPERPAALGDVSALGEGP